MSELRINRRKDECPYYLSEEGKRYYEPNHAQLITAVKGRDQYHRIRPKRTPLQQFGYAVLVLILLIASFGSLFVIAEALSSSQIVK